ncbi:MAG: cation:dicarboxylase symporter family transporter, partial [Veillonella sp.]|nr:cation:dicarboxylase symporter family transporter [Veillonella sp.]
MNGLVKAINRVSLIKQIAAGLIIGIVVALLAPEAAKELSLLGTLFVGALKGIAPVLVFFLVLSAISQHRAGGKTGMSTVVVLYLLATFLAAVTAVIVSYFFPTTLHLQVANVEQAAPEGIVAVLTTLLKNIVDNPVHALMSGNYIGILGWSLLFGFALRTAPQESKSVFDAISSAVSTVVNWIIHVAPLGIMGLVADAIATNGIDALLSYAQLLVILLGTMIFVAL